jgi:hypothetical protein
MIYSKEKIEKAIKAKGYKWFEGPKDYDLNIVGVRNSAPGKKVTNIFDDTITVTFKIGDEWIYKEWACTTDPGKKAMEHFHNSNGVARLVPHQYRGSHALGLHQGKYEALRQVKPVTVYRDSNKDLTYDESMSQTGLFGINIHKSNPTTESQFVENWSEGCQVFKRAKDFNEFMLIVKTAAKTWPNSFTYTLLTSNDIL